MERGDETQVLNLARLHATVGTDAALIHELVELYVADTRARVHELLEAARTRELRRVWTTAHGLKGASAALGCEEAAGAFRQLEELGREGHATGLDEQVALAQAAWRRACERLRELAA